MVSACHVAFDVHESSQVGEARRAATRIAAEAGFDETAIGRVALVATELGNNLVRHATRGRLLIAAVQNDAGAVVVEILSLDHGPGIADLAGCMTDGYSTGGTPGTGLGAVRRLSDEFDLYSAVPSGTLILARVGAKLDLKSGAAPAADRDGGQTEFSIGAISLAAPGEVVCGDAWGVVRQGERAALMVADGLGHGPFAAEASLAALSVFEGHAFESPSDILQRAHTSLRSTRGAAVAVAQVDRAKGTLVFSGAGNIVGRLLSGVEDRSLMSQHGTAGVQIGRLHDVPYEWPQHSMLIMHSDGITTRWKLDGFESILSRHPTVIAAWLMRDHCRGRDDATVAVLKRRKAG